MYMCIRMYYIYIYVLNVNMRIKYIFIKYVYLYTIKCICIYSRTYSSPASKLFACELFKLGNKEP